MDKRNNYLDCKIKIDSLIAFLKHRRYGNVCNRTLNDDISDRYLYEKALYFETCHLAAEAIEKLFQLLSKNNIKNSSHSLNIYLSNSNLSQAAIDKIKFLVQKNDSCFVETRYPDYYGSICDRYELNELLFILNTLLTEANTLGYSFENTFIDSREYGIYSLSDYTLHCKFANYLIDKFSLDKLVNSIGPLYNDFSVQKINDEFKDQRICKQIIIDLINDEKNKNSDDERKNSGSLTQKYAYSDALTKFYTLHWYLENIDRTVYGESGENSTYLETNLSMSFINKKSNDNDIMQNYIYYNACHLAAEAIEKMFKTILLYNGISYEQLKADFGHSFTSMFEKLTENQKQLMYNEALGIYNPTNIKKLGSKPNKPEKPQKKFDKNDYEHLYTFDGDDIKDDVIKSVLNSDDEEKGWQEHFKDFFIVKKRIGEMYLKKVLVIMDKAFIETRYPEQFSINFNYKYNLNYMIEILKSLRHISELIFEIWRYKSYGINEMVDYEMNIAKEAHSNLEFEQVESKDRLGNNKYHIIDEQKTY